LARPLDGIRVLDFSKVLAGPLCTQYLSDMGADVIKVEPVEIGDETRGWPPFRAGFGTVFLSANRGKRSIALDLKAKEGRDIAHRLARQADVAIESFGTGVAERLGIDSLTLRGLNPRLVYCSISGFGRNGPLKDAPGYDVILQAFSGIMSLTGEEGGSYVRSPISPIDQMTGIHALSGILGSLYAREKSGEGALVEVSLFETAVAVLGYNLQSFWERGTQPARCGSSHESLCPYQAFETADGPVLIGVANDNLWRKFCAVAGLEDIVDDPRFRTNADRAANRAETVRRVQEAVGRRPVSFWVNELGKARVPCSPINSLRQLLEHPHTEASGILLEYEDRSAGSLKTVAQPVRFSSTSREVNLPPPEHGEHTDEILLASGFSEQEISELKKRKIVR